MEQLFFVQQGRVEWRDIPSPRLADNKDALVRPVAVATCDLDTALVHGAAPFPGPFPIGHEGVGEVVEIGSEVSAVSVGQRVVVPFQVSCGSCARCSRGLTGSCENVPFGAMYGLEPFGGPWGGFLCDLIRVPWADHMLIPLPESIDPLAVASLSDNIPDAWRAVAPFTSDPGTTSVLVIGGWGPSIPFYTVALAKALGIPQVDYLSVTPPAPRMRPMISLWISVVPPKPCVHGAYLQRVRQWYFYGMRTAIDSAGRVVIPKAFRDALGLTAGQPLEITEQDGRLEIVPTATPMRLVDEGDRVAAVADADMPVLTAEVVRDTLERIRR